MKKFMILTAILCLLLALPSCGGEEKGTPGEEVPLPPVETIKTMHGSFESKFKRYAQRDKHAGQTVSSKIATQWRDTVWRNERVHTQLILWADKEVKGITYQVNELKCGAQTILASNIRLRFPTYVLGDTKALDCAAQTTRQSAYIADALSEQQVNQISSSDPTKVWITIDVPKTTSPGLYEGSIDVKQEDGEKLSFSIQLLVTDHTLPDVADWVYHLDIWQFPFQLVSLCAKDGTLIEPFSPAYETLMSSFYKMLADAGQKAVTTYIKDGAFLEGQTMVEWSLNPDNSWNFDYAKFDKFVEFMFSLGINKQIDCFSLVGWNNSIGYFDIATSSHKTRKLPIGTDEYNEVWTTFLTSFRAHLSSKGWFGKAVLFLDEARDEETRQVVNLIRRNGTDWKIGLAGSRIAADIEEELYDYCTLLGYNRASTNRISTFYTSCSQMFPNNYVSKETSSAEMVWMAWHVASKGLNGYLRWAFDYWQSTDPKNIQDGTNTAGDFHMIYRTNNTASSKVVASIRFEMLREGIQDYEKIRILAAPALTTALQSIDAASARTAEKTILKTQGILKQASAN